MQENFSIFKEKHLILQRIYSADSSKLKSLPTLETADLYPNPAQVTSDLRQKILL